MQCDTLVIQPVCNPCAKSCTRVAYPYVGWLGIIDYVVEIIIVIWLSLMLVDVVTADHRIILGLILAWGLLTFILWIVNIFWRAPCYTLANTMPVCNLECGLELVVKGCPGDFAVRVAADIQHSDDETHLRNSLLTALYFAFMYAIFVGTHGNGVFDELLDTRTALQETNFVVGRILIMALIGAIGLGIRALLDATPDLLYRLLTAVDMTIPKEVALGNKKPTSFANKKMNNVVDINAFTS